MKVFVLTKYTGDGWNNEVDVIGVYSTAELARAQVSPEGWQEGDDGGWFYEEDERYWVDVFELDTTATDRLPDDSKA